MSLFSRNRRALVAGLLVACSGTKDDVAADAPLTEDDPTIGNEGETPLDTVTGPRDDAPVLAQTPPADFADGSCQGITTGGFLRDADGWTLLPDETTGTGRIIFVSATETPRNEGPKYWVSTAKAGFDLMRRGQPDIVLFKRGETFDLAQTMPSQNLSGPSQAAPQRIGAYGSGVRPVIHMAGTSFLNVVNTSLSNLAITSLEITTDRPADSRPEGIRLNTSGASANLLLEDVKIRGFQNDIALIPDATKGATMTKLQIRRSQVLDAYPLGGNSSGLYAAEVDGLLFEETIFDHNGWLARTGTDGLATIFDHDAYVQVTNRCFTARQNIFSRASSHGLQARAGGIVEDNLFLEDPLALSWGAVNGDGVVQKLLPVEGVTGRVTGNVALDSVDITATSQRDGGFTVGNARWVMVSDNVIARHQLRPGQAGIGFDIDTQMGIGVHNAVFQHNVLFELALGARVDGTAFGPVTLKNDGVNDTFVNDSYTHDYFVDGKKVIDVDESKLATKGTPRTELNGGDIYLTGTSTRVIRSGRSGLFFPEGTPEKTIADVGTRFEDDTFASVTKAFAFPTSPVFSLVGNTLDGTLVAPTRSVGTYMTEKAPGSVATDDGFLEQARSQRKNAWDRRFTAKPVVDYVKAGLAKK